MDKLNRKIMIFHKFLEISMQNFANLDEDIIKQLIIEKKGGKNQNKKWFKSLFSSLNPWIERWVIITTEGIGYITHNKKRNKHFREYNYYP